MSDTDNIAANVPSSARNYLKTNQVMERGCDEAPKPQDSTIRFFCTDCGKGFKSRKALCGHMRIHNRTHGTSKTGIHHIKLEREHSPEEDKYEDGFGCLVCKGSFSSMKLLLRHMIIHRDTDSDAVPRTPMSQERASLSKVIKQGIQTILSDHNTDLVKDLISVDRSQTGKTGSKRTAGDDKIYDAVPLRVYYGPETQTRKKKKKTGDMSMAYQDTSMDGAADSKSTEEQSVNCVTTPHTFISIRSMKKTKAAKRVHQCEICSKIFETGQALGGHKTKHRVKAELVQSKTKQECCEESGEVRELVTRMLLPGLSPEDAQLSEQAHPKRMLDFDLNIPMYNFLLLF